MRSSIHPTAVIDPRAELAEGVEIGPFAVIEADVTIGTACRIAAHAIVRRFSVLEDDVTVDSFAVVGGLPQDLSFSESTRSGVRIGAGTVVREGVTINRSTVEGGVSRIGKNCFLMANSHVAHDCELGNDVILANNAMLGGHVHVGDGSFLGGGCGIHQFVSIGKLVMVAGNASVTHDVPSYLMVAERSLVTGLNLVGLKRKLSKEAISELRACYKAVYMKTGDPAKFAKTTSADSPEAKEFLACFSSSRRGRFSRSRMQV
ncbi:MAG TPA: acyl-ACP--UDP-N-acetylglucosamine O-acyltransferase [Opitutales bacterium]|nr:acyl-ACP--UDP-N-acetylglucosamine O-acyltransferase [Opitutales bacterium]